MMTDENANDAQVSQQSTEPELKLRRLDRLVGTWEVSGGLQGKVSYEWMEGGFFLIQRFDFDHDGRRIKGFEVIGRERMLGAERGHQDWCLHHDGRHPRVHVRTGGDNLKIWFGDRGSPAYFEGTFGEDGRTYSGSGHFPGGGGYEVTGTRVEGE